MVKYTLLPEGVPERKAQENSCGIFERVKS